MDDILLHGKKQEVDALKARFGLETLQHNDDFMFALSMTIGNLWQNGDWKDKEYNTQHSMVDGFALWCDSIENATAHATSSRIEAALNGYVEFWKAFGYDYGRGYAACPDDVADAECFNFHEPTAPQYADTSVDNLVGRQFQWISCNEVAWWQTGAPTGHPTLISRLLTADYFTAQCALWFPSGPNGETYGLAKSHQVIEDINAMTGGWNPPNTSRLIYVNNEFDPWREASVSSSFRPGGPMESTEHIPIKILPAGRHASDTYTGNARLNEGAKQVIDEVIAQLKAWVGEWYTQKGRKIPWEA
ncbi:unnamed protein product [Zymoseptoria tritici ST99CH_3D1]|nr:unnamed protein product [Zymoseptoria tritici ST99CH_3D1]